MSRLKGQVEYEKWEKGDRLTRKEAMLAHCYYCNGQEDSRVDCLGKKNCPVYEYAPYKGYKR